MNLNRLLIILNLDKLLPRKHSNGKKDTLIQTVVHELDGQELDSLLTDDLYQKILLVELLALNGINSTKTSHTRKVVGD